MTAWSTTRWMAAAPVVSFAVVRSVLSLIWDTVSTLLGASPANVDIEEIPRRVEDRFGPASLRHLLLWEVGPGRWVLTALVGVAPEMDGAYPRDAAP